MATSERKKKLRARDTVACAFVASVKILFPDSLGDHLPGNIFVAIKFISFVCRRRAHSAERRMEEKESLNNDEVEFSALIKIE